MPYKNKERLIKYRNSDKMREYYRNYKKTEKYKNQQKEYKKTHKAKELARNCILKNSYGISLEEYSKMLEKQSGVCAICGRKDKTTLCVDHDHKTGKVRGLLCHQCNLGIGNFDDNIPSLEKAIKYISNY